MLGIVGQKGESTSPKVRNGAKRRVIRPGNLSKRSSAHFRQRSQNSLKKLTGIFQRWGGSEGNPRVGILCK